MKRSFSVRTKFVKVVHPERKVVLKLEDGEVVALLRHWRMVPCDPRRCSASWRKGYACLFLCDTEGRAPLTREKQVFAGTKMQCEQFIRGFQKGRILQQRVNGSRSEFLEWLQTNKVKHTCQNEVMPVFQGIEAFHQYESTFKAMAQTDEMSKSFSNLLVPSSHE